MSWRAACSSFGRAGSVSSGASAPPSVIASAIDEGDVVRGGGLDQAQPRVIRAFAHELGVERERAAAMPRPDATSRARRHLEWEFRRKSSSPYYAHAATAQGA